MSVLTTEATPLDVLRDAFALLCAEPCALAVPAEEVAAFIAPARDLTLREIKRLLMAEGTRADVKRALWGAVIRRAQRGEASWTLAAAGLAYPALAGKVLLACRRSPAEADEIQAEVLVEFLAALRTVDVEDPRISHDLAGYLAWRAFMASRRFRRAEAAAAKRQCELPSEDSHAGALLPAQPEGHPDLVLARALRAGVIDQDEADWIARTCLGDQSAADVAAEYEMGLSTFYRRRTQAGRRIAAAIESGDLEFA